MWQKLWLLRSFLRQKMFMQICLGFPNWGSRLINHVKLKIKLIFIIIIFIIIHFYLLLKFIIFIKINHKNKIIIKI